MKSLLTFLAVTLTSFAAFAGDYPDITIAELKTVIAAKTVTIIDVNGTQSWQSGHIPGAIDFASNKAKLAALLPQDKGALIVAYCGGPMCHAYQSAADAAEKLGYKNVKHLAAGISGWRDASEPLEQGN